MSMLFDVHHLQQPCLPFVPLLLKPIVACELIDAEMFGCLHDIVGAVGRCRWYHLVVVSEREPAGTGHPTGEVDAVVVARTFDAGLTGVLDLIEVMWPSAGNALQLTLVVAHGIVDSAHETHAFVESGYGEREKTALT